MEAILATISLACRPEAETMTWKSQQPDQRSVIDAVDENTRLLQKLIEQFADFQPAAAIEQPYHHDQADQLQLQELHDRISELEQQNHDLATQLASVNLRQTVATANSSTDDALSWEQRKEIILRQMDEESFDADAFVKDLQTEYEQQIETPAEFIEHLQTDLEKCEAELVRRNGEIGELKCLLQQHSETRESGVAIGAAAIAQMVDSDELVQQERERLQQLQTEWEEKFRQSEIKASLERAKLSRERQEVVKKTAELEEQLEHLRRDSKLKDDAGSTSSRRWLVKLGLTENGA